MNFRAQLRAKLTNMCTLIKIRGKKKKNLLLENQHYESQTNYIKNQQPLLLLKGKIV